MPCPGNTSRFAVEDELGLTGGCDPEVFDEVTARRPAGQAGSLPARMAAGPERELGALAGAAPCRAYPCGLLGPRAIAAAGEAGVTPRCSLLTRFVEQTVIGFVGWESCRLGGEPVGSTWEGSGTEPAARTACSGRRRA
ncbi:hypothetical protein YIM_16395 [Amycolatopsis sp. YIM 10]|nr:hypothetical protein YIM_16395 [Amycolatopsis sp. YIM 10]